MNVLTSVYIVVCICLSSLLLSKSVHGLSLSRRDVFIHSTTAATVVASSTSILPSSASASASTSASTSTSTSTSIDGTYLTSEYYNNQPITAESKGRFYFPTITPPFKNRATYRYNLGRNTYAFEQLLTFANVTATIRMTVIQLEHGSDGNGGNGNGGLWVHSPQYPTGELRHLLDELGVVQHIVLPCNAFEHAAPMKAFVKCYPNASVWVSPGQYGPFGSCGLSLKEKCSLGYRVDGIFDINGGSSSSSISTSSGSTSSTSTSRPPWSDEIEYKTLYVNLPENAGPVSEVAFFHKPTKTLIATDALIYIPDTPSPIFSTYFDNNITNKKDKDGKDGKDESTSLVSDPNFWPKTVLQSVFLPLRTDMDDSTGTRTIRYPGYDAIQGRLIRAPILRGFNDARSPILTKAWIDDICSSSISSSSSSCWDFDRVVTSHFASPIAAMPHNVKNAFSFLDSDDSSNGNDNDNDNDNGNGGTSISRKDLLPPIACQDWELLDSLNDFIATNKIGAPASFDYRKDCK